MNSKTLSIGGLRLDLTKPTQSAWRRRVLAQRFETPVEFFTALVQKLSANGQATAEELANQLRTSVLDYKYLSEKWTQYHPDAAGKAVKMEALKCLQAADLDRGWQMFIDLKKPAPPTVLK